MKRKVGLAPAAEIIREVRLELPALRGHELGSSGILAAQAQLRLCEEIGETDLPDAPSQLEANVPRLVGVPAKNDAALRPEGFDGLDGEPRQLAAMQARLR